MEDLYAGMGKCLSQYDAVLAGGETCRVPDGSAVVISVSATGSVERSGVIFRSGGKPGDDIYVTGSLGGSLSGKHLIIQSKGRGRTVDRTNAGATAMMDISDGLAKDLPRLVAAANVDSRLGDELVPVSKGAPVRRHWATVKISSCYLRCRPNRIFTSTGPETFPKLKIPVSEGYVNREPVGSSAVDGTTSGHKDQGAGSPSTTVSASSPVSSSRLHQP